jgi:hypothetical protein
MKWGYVSYHFSHHYINYCILCNEKAKKKPSRAVATLGSDTWMVAISTLCSWLQSHSFLLQDGQAPSLVGAHQEEEYPGNICLYNN